MRVLNDLAEAEDMTQDAMLRLWRIAPDRQSGQAQVSTWLYRVALNLCRDWLRRGRGGSVALDAITEPEDGARSAAEDMQARHLVDALKAVLRTLHGRQRQAVILRHLEELPNPEIAKIVELGVEAIESLIARGKRALAAGLKWRRDELGYTDD